MPKRILDGDAMWASSKLSQCRPECIAEYAWLYPLADANGSFEISEPLRVMHGKVAAIRPLFTEEDLKITLSEFRRNGLLFMWRQDGKMYGHWTGSDRAGRLPAESQRKKYPTTVPLPPKALLDRYLEQVQSSSRVGLELLQPGLGFGVGLGVGVGKGGLFDGVPAFEGQEHKDVNQETDDYRLTKFNEFWNLYPIKLDDGGAYEAFAILQLTDLDVAVENLKLWVACERWKNQNFIPKARNFLREGYWNTSPPKETGNGKHTNYSRPRNAVNSGRPIDTSHVHRIDNS